MGCGINMWFEKYSGNSAEAGGYVAEFWVYLEPAFLMNRD